MEFSNLPGLVLELQKGNVVFLAEKIIFDSKNKIDFDLTKFQSITKEERDIYLKKQRESYNLKFGN
jgi:GLPGLI family protein